MDEKLVSTYRELPDGSLERIRFSQTMPGDRIRIVDKTDREKDGMSVFKVAEKPSFSVRTGRWTVYLDDKEERKPIRKRAFQLADQNSEQRSPVIRA